MKLPAAMAWLVGVAVLAALVVLNDPRQLFASIAAMGFWLIAILAWHIVPLLFDARAWQFLFSDRPRLLPLLGATWIGEGVNGLLPIPHLGEIARARVARHATATGEAAAAVVVDLTLSISTELIFALLGLALLCTRSAFSTAWILGPGGAVIAASALIFYLLQRAGLFALALRLAHRWSAAARRRYDIGSAEALDRAVRRIYQRRGALLQSAGWRLGGWLAGAGETWLVFHAMGRPIDLSNAIIIESLGHAARTAAFIVPGGLGVQDGALLLLGSAVGVGAEAGLVLALTKRLARSCWGCRRWRRVTFSSRGGFSAKAWRCRHIALVYESCN